MNQQAFSFSILPELIEELRAARRVVALTGAGISAESGVLTFGLCRLGFDDVQRMFYNERSI
jgi:NAD-dependent SIR2 family protein deacetylase